jgi:hypothetical protein
VSRREPVTFDPETAGPKCIHCGYYEIEHFSNGKCPAPLRWGGRYKGDWLLPGTEYQAAEK